VEELHFQKDKWWVSPYNFVDEVLKEYDLPAKVSIHDATLRDGEQTPGVVFRKEDKIRIAQALDEIGVERIEAGMAAVSDEDFQAIKAISKLGLNAKIFAFARTLRIDIDKAVDCGANGVIIEIPIGYPKLKYQFGWTWKDVLRKSADVIDYAKRKGLYAVYFPYDTTRAREEDFEDLLTNLVKESSPDSIGIVDTMGCALPSAVKYLVRKAKRITGLPIEIHTHNDFGMAVATELAAVTAGAEVVHTCINGLGERTGNAALEELMMGIHVLLGFNTGYRFDRVVELASLAQDLSGIRIPRNKPVTGEENFTRESGIGIDLVVNNPLVMFGMHPRFTGRDAKIVLGKKSGRDSIKYALDKLGIKNVGQERIMDILQAVKTKGIEKKSLVSAEEFKEIVGSILG
jgi:methanogen homocitrate synthase